MLEIRNNLVFNSIKNNQFVSIEKSFAPSGRVRLVAAAGISRRGGDSRVVGRRFGAPGNHTVPCGAHGRVCADALDDAGQTVQTGNDRRFTAAAVFRGETRMIRN